MRNIGKDHYIVLYSVEAGVKGVYWEGKIVCYRVERARCRLGSVEEK